MVLYHYSGHEIKKLKKKKEYPQWAITCNNKPCGMWFSVLGEEGWAEWCKREGFRLEDLTNIYKAKLKSNAKILKITKESDLIPFYEKYKTAEEILDKVMPWRKKTIQPFPNGPQFINWVEVAKDYQGIYIETYSAYYWMPNPWLYGWDCISACIWDLSCVESFTK